MDGEGTTPDDLRVSLNWPGDEQDVAKEAGQSEPDVREAPDPTPPPWQGPREGQWQPPRPPQRQPQPQPGEETEQSDQPISAGRTEERETDEGRTEEGASASATVDWATLPPLLEENTPGLRRRRPAQAPPGAWPDPGLTSADSFGPGDVDVMSRIERLLIEVVATKSRVDTLSDATVTLRGFVNERLADIGQAVSQSQSRITREITEAIRQIQPPASPDVDAAFERARSEITREMHLAVSQSQAELATEIDDAVSRSQARTIDDVSQIVARTTSVAPDLDDAFTRSQEAITGDLDRALTRFQNQGARHLDEALIETQARASQDIEAAVGRGQGQLLAQLDELITRWQAQASRQTDQLVRRSEQVAATVSEGATVNRDALRRIDQLSDALSVEVATVGQQVSAEVGVSAVQQRSELSSLIRDLSDRIENAVEAAVDAGITATRVEASASAERAVADITVLSETVADALTQVADRLESLAESNSGQQTVVEAVAEALEDVAGRVDDLDQAGRSRHDRLMAVIGELRSARNQRPTLDLTPLTTSLATIEVSVEALTQAAEVDNGVADLVDRVEELEATLADRLERSTNAAVKAVTQAADKAAKEIKAAPPPAVDRSSVTAMTRIEDRLAELTRQREETEEVTQVTLNAVEETVSRLASAQAEDLERILDTVENFSVPTETSVSLAGRDVERLVRIETELRTLAQRPTASVSAEGDTVIGEQLAALGTQIEALRRRMAVRARSPMLDDDAIEALAEAVAARLEASRPPRPVTKAARAARATGERSAGRRRPTTEP